MSTVETAQPSLATTINITLGKVAFATIIMMSAIVFTLHYIDYDHLYLDHVNYEARLLFGGVKSGPDGLSFALPPHMTRYNEEGQSAYGFGRHDPSRPRSEARQVTGGTFSVVQRLRQHIRTMVREGRQSALPFCRGAAAARRRPRRADRDDDTGRPGGRPLACPRARDGGGHRTPGVAAHAADSGRDIHCGPPRAAAPGRRRAPGRDGQSG